MSLSPPAAGPDSLGLGNHVEKEDISVDEFHQLINHPNDILLLDVRKESEFEAWRIEGLYTPETMHIPYMIFAEDGPYALL